MMLSRSSERRRDIQRRLQDMRTLPAFGRSYLRTVEGGELLCGRRDGSLGAHSQEAIVVLALDARVDDRDGGSQVAGLISLAKTFDVHEPPMRSVVFCVTAKEGGVERYFASPAVPLENTVALFTLGAFGGAPDSAVTRVEGVTPTGGSLIHLENDYVSDESSPSSQLDFHTILSAVQVLYQEIRALQE
jgi:hypothetical protein